MNTSVHRHLSLLIKASEAVSRVPKRRYIVIYEVAV